MRFIAPLLLALASLVGATASAQDISGRVGRVAYTEGPVAIYRDPDIGWEKAFVNSPLTSENSLWTEPGSRAEARVSSAALRLDGATQVDVSRLDDEALQASLVRGSLGVRIRHDDFGGNFVIDTPEARFIMVRAGRYRIDVDVDRGETRLAVFAGEAMMETSQGRERIAAGRMVRIADGDYVFERPFSTDFDRWTVARDSRWIERRSTQYVSTYMTGYEDLDQYGEWIQDPTYGVLWAPTRVKADWVPYRYGHWSDVRPWGWTWIDDEPWGYAPFHYGRWVQVRGRWCWYPGKREAQPAWAPALVAWVGGSGLSVGVNTGAPLVGWYPLAPNERYQPSYRANQAYVNRVNNMVVSNGSRERRAPQDVNRTQAITVMNREQMIERRPVAQSMVRVSPEAARTAQVVAPQAVMPTNTEIQRMRTERARTAPPSVASAPATQRASQPQPQQQQPGERAPTRLGRPGPAPGAPQAAQEARTASPVAPIARPNFARPQAAPAPAPAAAAPAQPGLAPRPQAAQQPGMPAANPLARGNRGEAPGQDAQRAQQQQQQQQAQERVQREQQAGQQRAAEEQQRAAQQAQDRASRDQQAGRQRAAEEQQRAAQQAQERAARDQQAAQQRGAAEAQQRAQQQQQQQAKDQAAQQQRAAQQQQQQAQQRAAEAQQRAAAEAQQRGAAEAQQRAAAEAQQRAQQQQQQQAKDQAAQQQRAAQQQQQQAQQRAAEAQQRAQQQQQQAKDQAAQQQRAAQQQAQQRAAEAQQRAAAEAQQRAAQQAQQRAAPAPAAAPASAPPPQGNPAAREARTPGKGPPDEKGKEKEKEKDKGEPR